MGLAIGMTSFYKDMHDYNKHYHNYINKIVHDAVNKKNYLW